MSADALRQLAIAVGSGTIRQLPGDVVSLDLGNGLEVCNEDGTFDIWVEGRLTAPSLSRKEAERICREAAA
jgi:hypothetical protein